jgi:hypothetical protein
LQVLTQWPRRFAAAFFGGLADGLILGKSSQEFNSQLIPTPNTQVIYISEGNPAKAGFDNFKMSLTINN